MSDDKDVKKHDAFMTYKEIAEEMGVSMQYIQMVEKRALAKLKKWHSRMLMEHL